MLKQIGNRFSGVSPVTLWRWRQLYHYNDHRNVDKGVVGAPVCEDVMKPQIKIDDEMRKRVEDYFKDGITCMNLVACHPNVKMIVDDKTGKVVNIVGLDSDVGFAGYSDSYFVTEDSKTYLSRPPVKLQYGGMLADDAITAALKDHKVKKAKFSDHSENAVDA